MTPARIAPPFALLLFALFGAAGAQDAPEPRYAATVEKVAALTGPDAPSEMRAPDVCGTDIGTMAELDGRLYLAFGDTFGWSGETCSPFGPNWRSNVVAHTADLDPTDGVVLDGWIADEDGVARAVSEGAHQSAFQGEQTRIPTAMVAVGDRLFLHVMSVHGFAQMGGVWLCNGSRFLSSDDGGESWTEAEGEFGRAGDTFNMLALSAQAGAGNDDGAFVYAIGTPCGRFGGARAARAPQGRLLEPDAWEYWDGAGWAAERDAAAEVIRPPVGEGSLAWNPGLERWMFTSLDEHAAAIVLRLAPAPQGPWGEPITLAEAGDYPSLYGAFLTPSWIGPDGTTFHFVMSQFGPYNTFVMRATLAPQP